MSCWWTSVPQLHSVAFEPDSIRTLVGCNIQQTWGLLNPFSLKNNVCSIKAFDQSAGSGRAGDKASWAVCKRCLACATLFGWRRPRIWQMRFCGGMVLVRYNGTRGKYGKSGSAENCFGDGNAVVLPIVSITAILRVNFIECNDTMVGAEFASSWSWP